MYNNKINESMMLFYSQLNEPKLSFDYFNRHKIDSLGKPFECRVYQVDYQFGPILKNSTVIASGRSLGKCHHNNNKILQEDGTYITVGELVNKDFKIQSFNEKTNTITWETAYASDNGNQECFEVILEGGLKTIVTKEHPFLTQTGWTETENLKAGYFVVQQEYLPEHTNIDNSVSDDELKIIGYLLGDGCLRSQCVTFTNINKEIIKELSDACLTFNCTLVKERTSLYGYRIKADYKSNNIKNLIRSLGLDNTTSPTKFIPDKYLKCGNKKLAILINRLFACDGWYSRGSIGYCTVSEVMMKQVQQILLRFGIRATYTEKRVKYNGGINIAYQLNIPINGVQKFYEQIGIFTKLKENIIIKPKTFEDRKKLIPMSEELYEELQSQRILSNDELEKTQCRIRRVYKSVDINKLQRFLKFNNINTKKYEHLWKNIVWVKIKSIKSIGVHPTTSISVPETGTHVVDGILSHNSFMIGHYVFKWCLTHPGLHCGIIVKNEVHARGLVKYIDDYFGINEFTSSFYVSYDKKNRLYTLSNGCTIEFRIAGADRSGATTLVAGHFNLLIIDEAQLMYATTLPELIPMLQRGGKMIVTGVPNNLRDMILYHYCSDPDAMYYKYASTESADWDEEKEKEFLKHYKGGKDSPQWKNLVCLPKRQMVVVPNGLKDISEIVVGDLVLTHKNRFKKVTETFKREYSGNINIINQSHDDNLLITTDNHPISCRKKKTKQPLKGNTHEELKFIEAKYIEKNDKIQFANIETEKEKLTFTLPDFSYRGVFKRENRYKWHCNICYNNNVIHLGDYNTPELAALRYNVESWKLFKEEGFYNNIDNTIDIDEEIMYALGLYAAEGSTTKHQVCYSLHRKEINFIDKLNKFFIRTPRISYLKKDKGMRIVYSNKVLAKLFKTLIPGVKHTKYINFNIYSLDNNLKIAFLKGYFDGDRCSNFNKGELCYKSPTTSINLAYQLRLLLRSLKINASLNTLKEGTSKIRDKEYNGKKQYTLSVCGYCAYELAYLFNDVVTNKVNKPQQSKRSFDCSSNVISNKTEHFKGTVYNIEVEEDNSYTVFDSVVHNCAEWGDASESVFRPSKLVENIKEIEFQFTKMDVEFYNDAITRLKLPILNPKYHSYIIGSDSGYTERSPMHISILGCYNLKTKIDGEMKDREHYDLVCRIEISGMLSYEAAKLLNYLLTYFNSPYFCLDAQNYGANIYSNLTNREIFPETCSRNAKIVLPIKFGDTIIIGEKKEFDLRTGKEITVDEKKAIKCATTDKMVELLENNRFHISNFDQGSIYFEDIYSILQCEVQTKSPTNNKYHPVTYSNSKNDHAVDSIRCCAYIIRQINEKGLYFKFKKRTTIRPIIVGSR